LAAGNASPPGQLDFPDMLNISLKKLGYIIEKAREFDAEVPAEAEVSPEADSSGTSSNPADDGESGILLDTPDNPTVEELRDAIDGLNTDEQEELLALIWIGRGDFGSHEWKAAIRQAEQSRTSSEADYLIGTPLLADYLEEGVAALGLSLGDYEMNGE
jgi:hypothetical protein